MLTTEIVADLLGEPVSVTVLESSPGLVLGGYAGLRRQVELTVRGGAATPLVVVRARAVVAVELLPLWAGQVLINTKLPLGRVLSRLGALRVQRTTSTAPDPADPDEALLTSVADFHLPGHRAIVASVEEDFVLSALCSAPEPPAGVGTGRGARERAIDRLDRQMTELLHERREHARALTAREPSLTPPAYPPHNELLRAQLTGELGAADGARLAEAIARSGSPRGRTPDS
jgi:hypothetical protein